MVPYLIFGTSGADPYEATSDGIVNTKLMHGGWLAGYIVMADHLSMCTKDKQVAFHPFHTPS